jgi:hypothetical protein
LRSTRPEYLKIPQRLTAAELGVTDLAKNAADFHNATRGWNMDNTQWSSWRRVPSGRWKIIFDKGCPPCDCTAPT